MNGSKTPSAPLPPLRIQRTTVRTGLRAGQEDTEAKPLTLPKCSKYTDCKTMTGG